MVERKCPLPVFTFPSKQANVSACISVTGFLNYECHSPSLFRHGLRMLFALDIAGYVMVS